MSPAPYDPTRQHGTNDLHRSDVEADRARRCTCGAGPGAGAGHHEPHCGQPLEVPALPRDLDCIRRRAVGGDAISRDEAGIAFDAVRALLARVADLEQRLGLEPGQHPDDEPQEEGHGLEPDEPDHDDSDHGEPGPSFGEIMAEQEERDIDF